MTKMNFAEILAKVRQSSNLIHCITNPISINLLANGILALGCRPMMAEHPLEVSEISETASAILLNIGNITDARMRSIKLSAKTASAKGIPTVLDIAGVSCSSMRHEFVSELMKEYGFTLIKGNRSEIYSLYDPGHRSSGVDSACCADIFETEKICTFLANKYGCMFLASGSTDIISDGKKVVRISNGTQMLSKVTGTGCLQGAICACFLSAQKDIYSAALACSFLGICAELSSQAAGTATFSYELLDNISILASEKLNKMIKAEVKQIEEF